MSALLIAFVRDLDRCWIERRFDDLSGFLAADIIMVAPRGSSRIEGSAAAIDSYRSFMARSSVERFEASDFVVTERGHTAVVEYRWNMAWTGDGGQHEAAGREVLVLARRDREWRVIWRTQLPD